MAKVLSFDIFFEKDPHPNAVEKYKRLVSETKSYN